MTRPHVLPAFGPLDRLTPERSLPTLFPTGGDLVAMVAQQFEVAGLQVNLSPESLSVATAAAKVLLAALLPVPDGVRPLAVAPTPVEETDVPGL